MSRIGRQAVAVPDGVTVTMAGQTVTANGPKGTESLKLHPRVSASQDSGVLRVSLATTDKKATALQGLTVRLIQNLVTGVSHGFTKTLEINGVGYKAAVSGSTLTLNVGFSHPVLLTAPQGISTTIVKNVITISGTNKQMVGQFAAIVRSTKPPEPYKGKGIKYSDETIRRKAGKAAKAAGGAA
ncbi:50S ribosomal protein L6 [Candidatus Berkelbacteria bacterium]|nr:50S ribosomal protein L6 [Candidatus Berkelbacteria bacterium]